MGQHPMVGLGSRLQINAQWNPTFRSKYYFLLLPSSNEKRDFMLDKYISLKKTEKLGNLQLSREFFNKKVLIKHNNQHEKS